MPIQPLSWATIFLRMPNEGLWEAWKNRFLLLSHGCRSVFPREEPGLPAPRNPQNPNPSTRRVASKLEAKKSGKDKQNNCREPHSTKTRSRSYPPA